jgi:protein ImuA
MAAAGMLAALRHRIAEIERPPVELPRARADTASILPLGIPAVDGLFAEGGLPCGGSHQVATDQGIETAPAFAFALALLSLRLKQQPAGQALVLQEAMAIREGGQIYAPGLLAFGIDPDRIVCVCARTGADALQVVDDAVKSATLTAVIAELWTGDQLLDLAATRRFNIAAQKSQTLALLVTRDLSGTSAALTRWLADYAPSVEPRRQFVGRPAFSLELVRNRFGRTGDWILEWDCHERAFCVTTALSQSASRPSVDRSHPPRTAEAAGRRARGEPGPLGDRRQAGERHSAARG